MDSSFVSVGKARLRVDSEGSGRPVVMLHAGVADRRMWSAQVETLGARFRTITYDRRGFGTSFCDDESFSHVNDLKEVLAELGCESVTLVGASQGGRIAVDFTLEFPDLVERLVLVAPALSGDDVGFDNPEYVLTLAERIEGAEESNDLELINALEAWAWLDGPRGPEGRIPGDSRALFLEMNGIALRHAELSGEREPVPALPRLDEIEQPVLLVWGDRDFPHVIDRCERMARAISTSQAEVIANCAHLVPLEAPHEFNRVLETFLD